MTGGKRGFILCVLLMWSTLVIPEEKIAGIHFLGLTKTKESYLYNFIQSRPGDALDSLKIEKDVQSLRNIRLFRDVQFAVGDTTSGKLVVFKCEELLTLLPIVNFGGVTDNFWFQVGGFDYNWLGRGHTVGGYYRYYDRHSFEVALRMPYLIGRRWGGTTNVSKFSTIEPAYFEEGETDYNVDHWAFLAFGRYNFSSSAAIELGGGYLYERYEKNTDRTGPDSPGPDFEDFNKYLIKFTLATDFINYYYHYLNGIDNKLFIENVTTEGESDLFWKALNIFKAFHRSGSRGNWAFRLRTGLATNKVSPFVPFVLDNFITVRGAGNRVSRGTAELTTNLEYRYTLFDDRWTAVQGVAFLDMSAWRPAGGSFSEMFNDGNLVTFTGLGLRLHLRRFNNFIIRVDYGVSTNLDNRHGIVFGAGQYF